MMEHRKGVWLGVGAYAFWGLSPLFWNLVDDIAVTDLLVHRILWSLPVLAVVIAAQRRWVELWTFLRSTKAILISIVTASLISINWGVWLWAVTHEQIVEGSLGYFIGPLVSVLLGVVVLGERLRRLQWVAVGIAAFGVIGMTLTVGTLPWVSLSLAVSFGLYGLVKKHPDIPAPLISLSGEMLVVAIPAALVLGFLDQPDRVAFTDSLPIAIFLVATGVVTVTPLLLFAGAAKRVPLSMVGLLQYITPSMHFILGVWVFGEELSTGRLSWFMVVWLALGVYTYDSITALRVRAPEPELLG
jgi:chloramphenicol-sensitive protein RarD